MDIKSILEDIGLTKNEIKTYLALLKLGSTSTGAIIKETGTHGSKVYDALERLTEKGLVTYLVQSNAKHFKAVNPERFLDFLEEKKSTISLQEQEIKKILPMLKSLPGLATNETEAEIFRGWKGMETVFNEGIKEMGKRDLWCVLGAYAGEDMEKTDRLIQRVIMKCEKKKMRWKIIYNESARNTFKYEQESPITENRFLNQETPATINVYKDTTFIALWIKDPLAFRVRNQKVADSFRTYFEFMWNLARP